MKTMTAAAAERAFGSYLDAVEREPVVLTRNGQSVGVTLSMQDVEALFGPGEDAVERAIEQGRIDRQLAVARQQVVSGAIELADDAFFEARRENIRARFVLRSQP